MTVFLCGNGFDGILCGVYEAYASGLELSECRLEMEREYEPAFFVEYRSVETETWKADKVADKIKSRMSERAYLFLYRAALHKSPERADRILRFIRLGLRYGRQVLEYLQEPAVYEIFQMNRYVENEAHFLAEFVRFGKLENNVYFGTIGPENDVLELVADHFADRFPDMDWLLYDEKHKKAAIHSGKGVWAIREDLSEQEIAPLREQGKQDEYVKMWKTFFKTIAIEERKNPRCQRNMLPLRYRKYMTEFQ